jgi:hypothetical protein
MKSGDKNDDPMPEAQIVSAPEEKRILLRQFYLELKEQWRSEGKLTPERERIIERELSGKAAALPAEGALADVLREMAEKDRNAHLSDDEVEALTLEMMADEDD